LCLHFQLTEVKSALTEVKDKMDDVRMGEAASRGPGVCVCVIVCVCVLMCVLLCVY